MFLEIKFQSVNKVEELNRGTYSGVCVEFLNEKLNISIGIFEYTHVETNTMSVVDIVIENKSDNTFYATDIMKLKDYSWRNSFGLRADDLRDILPVELNGSERVAAYILKDVTLN